MKHQEVMMLKCAAPLGGIQKYGPRHLLTSSRAGHPIVYYSSSGGIILPSIGWPIKYLSEACPKCKSCLRFGKPSPNMRKPQRVTSVLHLQLRFFISDASSSVLEIFEITDYRLQHSVFSNFADPVPTEDPH